MSPSVASILNLPSTSVIVPFVVPLIMTLAPMTGSPCESRTVPETALIWALNKAICLLEMRKEMFLLLRNKFRRISFKSRLVS